MHAGAIENRKLLGGKTRKRINTDTLLLAMDVFTHENDGTPLQVTRTSLPRLGQRQCFSSSGSIFDASVTSSLRTCSSWYLFCAKPVRGMKFR